MASHEPREPNDRFAAAFSAGDMDGVLAVYEPRATMRTTTGETHVGTEAIREALRPVLALQGRTIAVDTHTVVAAGELALLRSDWTLRGTAPDGRPVTRTGRTVGVARRQADGSWRLAIEHSTENPDSGG